MPPRPVPSRYPLQSCSVGPCTPSDRSLTDATTSSTLEEAHNNLDARLSPFLSTAVPDQMLRIRVYRDREETPDGTTSPLHQCLVNTDGGGFFRRSTVIPWERLEAYVTFYPDLPGPRCRGALMTDRTRSERTLLRGICRYQSSLKTT